MEYKTGDPEYVHTCFVCKSIHNLDLDCPEAALVLRISQLATENAKLRELVLEGDSFAETIVRQNEALEDDNAALKKCDLCDELAEYRQCQKCMNDNLIGSHTDVEYEALQNKLKMTVNEEDKLQRQVDKLVRYVRARNTMADGDWSKEAHAERAEAHQALSDETRKLLEA